MAKIIAVVSFLLMLLCVISLFYYDGDTAGIWFLIVISVIVFGASIGKINDKLEKQQKGSNDV